MDMIRFVKSCYTGTVNAGGLYSHECPFKNSLAGVFIHVYMY